MSPWRAILALALLVWVAPSAAEERREEAVGVAPIRGRGSDKSVPRDAAVRAAVQAAVLRTARSLLPADFVAPGHSEPTPSVPGDPLAGPESWLEERLGDDPFAYATRFRILEDRGRRPAMFASDPEVEFEYVVMAEVTVDVDTLRERLKALGLLETRGGAPQRVLTLVIEGLSSYQPLAMLRHTLEEDGSVRSVSPVEFTDGRAVLAVDADRDARSLVADLSRRAPEGLRIVTVEANAATATLLVEWRPAPPPFAPGAPDADAGAD